MLSDGGRGSGCGDDPFGSDRAGAPPGERSMRMTRFAALVVATAGGLMADDTLKVHTHRIGDTEVKVCPGAGANLFSIRYKGRELLRQPEAIERLPGFMYGTPVLYPTPNRVKGAVMTFEGRTYKFPDNNNGNFLHGLVHDVPWTVKSNTLKDGKLLVDMELPFEPGSKRFELFPHRHKLGLAIEATDGKVTWTYTVDNTDGDGPVPFGFALHPWFGYQGDRKDVILTIPAPKVHKSIDLLPSGELLDVAGTAFDCRNGKSLEGFIIDDVYADMPAGGVTSMTFPKVDLKLELTATDEFKHLVVYTHQDHSFCVENQTNATDAHNLHAAGKKDLANLLIVPKGGKKSGSITLKFGPKAATKILNERDL
jgi:aldose 1-epimerase